MKKFIIFLIFQFGVAQASSMVEVVYEKNSININKSYFNERINHLNQSIKMKRPVTIIFSNSGEDAYYDLETSEIIVPYNFISQSRKLFESKTNESGIDKYILARDTVEFGIFHELSHAIIDQLDLPITSKEEDAADSLAAYLLVELFANGNEILVNAAQEFKINADNIEHVEEFDFWSEHSMDLQRYYNILCWAYGYSPEQQQKHIEQLELPEDRVDLCYSEGEKIAESWERILRHHLKIKK